MARPGGNVTGIGVTTIELMPKRLELLSDLIPQARVIALLMNPDLPAAERIISDMQEAAVVKGLRLHVLKAHSVDEIENAFSTLAGLHAEALVVGADPFFYNERNRLAALAVQHRVPAIYEFREYAAAGGLISYGTSLPGTYRQTSAYVARILAGAKPADLPVQDPVHFELVINLKTAKALGLTIPPLLFARADEIIE